MFVAFRVSDKLSEEIKMRANGIGKSFLVGAILAQAAGASIIIQSTGNSHAALPLGYYAPWAAGGTTPTVNAVSWTQTSDYVDVDVFANLFTPGSPGFVNYELVNAIGPGTSFAVNGLLRGTAITPINPADVLLFHVPLLRAGTYYLVLDSPVDNTSWLFGYQPDGTYNLAPGVSFQGDQWAYGTGINAAYTPASNFFSTVVPVQFAVIGTAAAPEPATAGGTGLVLMGFGLLLRYIRRRKG